MTDNFAPLWALVDGYRKLAKATVKDAQGRPFEIWWPAQQKADEYSTLATGLEKALREATGDQPVEEEPRSDLYTALAEEKDSQVDLVDVFRAISTALEGAASMLHFVADRRGLTVRESDARTARVNANRCSHALQALRKAGEL